MHIPRCLAALLLACPALSAAAGETPAPEATRAETVEKLFGMSEEKFDKIGEYADFYATRIINPKIQSAISDIKKQAYHKKVGQESIEESVAMLLEEPLAHWYSLRSDAAFNVDMRVIDDVRIARKDARVEKLLRIFFDGSKEDHERLRITTLDAASHFIHELDDEEVRQLCTGHHRNMGSAIVLPEILRRFPPEMANLRLLLQMHDRLRDVPVYSSPMPGIIVHAIKHLLPYMETYNREMEKLGEAERKTLEAYILGSRNAAKYASYQEMDLDDDIIEKDPQLALEAYRTYQAASVSWQNEEALIAQTLELARRVCGLETE